MNNGAVVSEGAMQELRMRQGQVSLWRATAKGCGCQERYCAHWNHWHDAECRLQGARAMLVAVYGTDVIDVFTLD